MPIYEYVCAACGKEFEALQKFSDDPLTECLCGEAGQVQRKLSLSAFQLKGGGWYKDLYGGGGSSGNGSSGGNGKAAGTSNGNGKAAADTAKAGTSSGSGESKGTGSAGTAKSGGTAST